MTRVTTTTGRHAGQPVLAAGSPLDAAAAAMVLIHGRGASARDILGLAGALGTVGIAYLAPQAAGSAWYPNRFIEPVARNEPDLTSALGVVAGLVADITAAGIPKERIVLAGFSQGACLALEFAARNPARYGAVIGLSGGLIGAPGQLPAYSGSLDGTPVFLGCSDVDFHIPLARVEETAGILGRLSGAVDARIYPGMGHTINDDEIAAVQGLLTGLAR